MAEWSNATMTDVGADLQAKVNAGKTKLTFTKIKVGSGVNATNPLVLTDVISPKWETTNFVVKQEGKIVSVDTFITNNGITEAFRMSEIGLFAQDPDRGEVLYAYLTDPEPDRMPAAGGSVVVSQELTIGMIFSNTGNVSLTVNMGALVTHEQLEKHNTDEHAHDNRFKQYLPTAGGTVTGNVKFNNTSAGFNNGNNTYDAKIRVASNGNFDIGVTEDSNNKNATAQLLLHSQNKPKWYNSAAGGKDIAMVEDINNAITAVDNNVALAKAPTLQLVKALLSGLNIKNATDVINALETNKASGLGIRYDFSNPNAWYICLGKLFGNLIIQGGRKLNMDVYDNLNYRQPFPISFSKNCLGVLVTLEGRGPVSGASVAYTNNRTITEFTIVTDASNAEAKSDLFYITLGI